MTDQPLSEQGKPITMAQARQAALDALRNAEASRADDAKDEASRYEYHDGYDNCRTEVESLRSALKDAREALAVTVETLAVYVQVIGPLHATLGKQRELDEATTRIHEARKALANIDSILGEKGTAPHTGHDKGADASTTNRAVSP